MLCGRLVGRLDVPAAGKDRAMPTSDQGDPRSRALELLKVEGKPPRKAVREIKQALLEAARQGDAVSQTLLGQSNWR